MSVLHTRSPGQAGPEAMAASRVFCTSSSRVRRLTTVLVALLLRVYATSSAASSPNSVKHLLCCSTSQPQSSCRLSLPSYEVKIAYKKANGDSPTTIGVEDVSWPLPDDEVRMYTHMILKGLSYIHAKGVVHCDLKPKNILLFPSCDDGGARFQLKIVDFRLSREESKGPYGEIKFRGTPFYILAESVLGEIVTTLNSDGGEEDGGGRKGSGGGEEGGQERRKEGFEGGCGEEFEQEKQEERGDLQYITSS
ncbi:hypothetical protein VNO78_06602 [Psophocarpus tetragonolobus]|uniref:Protein kinase domain-containing protein n=1 Tax=Psophocarpus tetragonolobus TaxID=3891 RepID=A0AAN9XRY9_PSOTE